DGGNDIVRFTADLDISVGKDIRHFRRFGIEETDEENGIGIDCTNLQDLFEARQDDPATVVRVFVEGIKPQPMVTVHRLTELLHLRIDDVLYQPVPVSVASKLLPARPGRLLCVVHDGKGTLK